MTSSTEARGALLIFETFLSGVFLEVEAVSGLCRVEIDHSLNHRRSKAYLATGNTICIDHYGTSVAITRPSQHSTHVLTPPATDADTMPPPLPTESQLAQEMESPQHITGPDDETEDEEQDPVIPPTSDAAQPPEVASEAASRSLRRGTRTKRNARDAYEVDLQQPPVKKTKSSQISPSSPAPHHPHSESEAPSEPAAAETAPEPTRAVENDASAVSQSPEQPKVDGGAEESAPGPAHEDERRNGENATPKPTQTSDTTEDDAVDETDDKIVVAQPTASNKKKRQSRSSLVSNSTLTPNSTSSRSQASPFLNRPKRTVLLSCLSPDAATKRWAKKYGITLQDDVPGSRANFLCVVKENRSQDPSSLPTTVKVLRTLLAKKLVVSETWITDSKEEDDVLDPSDYAVADGSERNRTKLFSGMTVYFTQKVCVDQSLPRCFANHDRPVNPKTSRLWQSRQAPRGSSVEPHQRA